ncbi:MAG: hypothetical protein K2K84_03140, partial [Muribaculaceae bacterium]|nr:hypothetical protein [Muribaculaceae bacterium]
MTTKEVYDIRNEINSYLGEQRIHDAFVKLRNVAEAMMLWNIVEESKRLEETYAFMLKYLTEGVADPSREELLGDLVTNLYRLTDEFVVSMLHKETPTLYYNIRRYCSVSGNSMIKTLHDFSAFLDKTHGLDNIFSSQTDDTLENDLFNAVWTTFPYTKAEGRELRELLSNQLVSSIT